MIEITERADCSALSDLFCEVCSEPRSLFKPLTAAEFENKFRGAGKYIVAAYDGSAPTGFAAGSLVGDCGYLSFIAVRRESRGRGVGGRLLSTLEARLFAAGAEKIEIVFRNPTELEWFIPGTNGDDHPCAPGVDVSSDAYIFLKNRGWRDFAMQNSYYLRMSDYRVPDDCADIRKRLEASGIKLTVYDARLHRGLPELFDDIGNRGWRDYVLSNLDKPVVAAVDTARDGLVVGYTGPLSVSAVGRGNFCGIGTLTAYRGRGIGKIVFCEMCRRHAERGASFMSLYTGETNNARNIYEAAGFRIVRSWADMRKMR